MTVAPVEPDTLVDEDLIQRFRDQLDEGGTASIACDRAGQFPDCPQMPAEFGAIVERHHGDCGGHRRNYCEPCFNRIKGGFRCLNCNTSPVHLARFWRL